MIKCEICSAPIPEKTGGYLDDLFVCDDCYDREVVEAELE